MEARCRHWLKIEVMAFNVRPFLTFSKPSGDADLVLKMWARLLHELTSLNYFMNWWLLRINFLWLSEPRSRNGAVIRSPLHLRIATEGW